MVCCSVAGCTNHGRKRKALDIRFHRFPKKSDVKLKWINACKRAGTFNFKNARICSAHFDDSDYSRELKNELLYLPKKHVLRPESVPHLNLPTRAQKLQDRKKTKNVKDEKKSKQKKNCGPKTKKINDEIDTAVKTKNSQSLTCCARGCIHTSDSMVMIRLPEDPDLRLQWVNTIDNEKWTPSTDSAICQIHFEPQMWEVNPDKGEQVFLKPDAIPTLFLKGPTIKTWDTTSNTGNMDNELPRRSTDIETEVLKPVVIQELMDLEEHAVYIKKEELPYESDEEIANSNKSPNDASVENQRPFESVYMDPNQHQDEEIANSNESPNDASVENRKPFESVYLDSNQHQVDLNEDNNELSSNFRIKRFNVFESETIIPEMCHVTVKEEPIETGETEEETAMDCENDLMKVKKRKKCYDPPENSSVTDVKSKDTAKTTPPCSPNPFTSSSQHATVLIAAPINNPQATPETTKKYLLLIPERSQCGVKQNNQQILLPKRPLASSAQPQPSLSGAFPQLLPSFQLPPPPQSSSDLSIFTSTAASDQSTMNQPTLGALESLEDVFSISLAHFSADTRIALKRKLIEFVDVVAKHNLDPNNIMLAYCQKK